MAPTFEWVRRPVPDARPDAGRRPRNVGIVLGLIGLMAVMLAAIGNLVAATNHPVDPEGTVRTLAWTFGVNTTGLGILKLGIAIILVGILARLWLRVDRVKSALPGLLPHEPEPPSPAGTITTPFGKATATTTSPPPLFVHRMARVMWLPMLVMGAMAVAVALVLSLITAAQSGAELLRLSAWTQGLMFLGETFLLSGVAFLLGTILAGLRDGGGEVQESLGVTVKTLRMPASGKAFLALMMIGLMVGVVQFVLYLVAAGSAGDPTAFSAWTAWLGPLREAGLGILLSGIVLALSTIAKVLGFQFTRIRELITTGA